MIVRTLTEQDKGQSWTLAMLAFGGDLRAPVPDSWGAQAGRTTGAFDDDGRLLGRVLVRPYEQWWGGRPVRMAGIAGVAVHPDARGQGLVRLMLEHALEDEPLSVLFPTAPGIYRPLGWEVVDSLDWTPIPLTSLPAPSGRVRTAETADLQAISDIYAARGVAGSGLLTRTGASFPEGVKGVLGHDQVSVALEDGQVAGFVAYSRGEGYDGTAELSVYDCLATTPTALTALLGSLRSWSAVAGTALWRGATAELGLHLGGRLPAPRTTQSWMLRVLDPVAAVAARGFAPGTCDVAFDLAGQAYRLEVEGGQGRLSSVQGEAPVSLTAQGFARLYAGQGWDLARNGQASRPVPDLAAAFAGPVTEILDYF